jgi:hypothetical protein
MDRRQLLRSTSAFAGAALFAPMMRALDGVAPASALVLTGAQERWQKTYDSALAVLAGNVKQVPGYDRPVLVEGAVYPGVWLECGPHESYVYRHVRPDIARQNHLAFFTLQRPDGQLPASIKMKETGYGQIQMVVPIAATAWEIAQETDDSELLDKAYAACSRWEDWLAKYRNTRGTGLVEGFCTYDTGHDNSPRWKGIPNRCPGGDAKKYPHLPGMPRICPDLSATSYGGRIALAKMANALGRRDEAAQWQQKADTMQRLILEKLYSPDDACFYDLDTNNQFIRIRGDLMTRVVGEHVVDSSIFAVMWKKQFGNPKAFWAPYPLPSIALNDPAFVRPIPRNSWGGATQALTALRAPRWMEHYGRSADMAHMMEQWTEAISRYGDFRQQMDPLTGDFTRIDSSGYSPAALVFFDYSQRLGGPRVEGEDLEWNVRPSTFAAGTRFVRTLKDKRIAEMIYLGTAVDFKLGGRHLLRAQGNVRLLTDMTGRITGAVGSSQAMQKVTLIAPSGKTHRLTLKPNQRVSFAFET